MWVSHIPLTHSSNHLTVANFVTSISDKFRSHLAICIFIKRIAKQNKKSGQCCFTTELSKGHLTQFPCLCTNLSKNIVVVFISSSEQAVRQKGGYMSYTFLSERTFKIKHLSANLVVRKFAVDYHQTP